MDGGHRAPRVLYPDIRLFISFREAMADVQRIDLLDPAEVARLWRIEIVAQGVVEGFLSGIHRSPFRGFSVESPSTVRTNPATSCVTSIGRSSPGPIDCS